MNMEKENIIEKNQGCKIIKMKLLEICGFWQNFWDYRDTDMQEARDSPSLILFLVITHLV
jgi:predicted nuclease of restriction endonuclease-like RecB superfamily